MNYEYWSYTTEQDIRNSEVDAEMRRMNKDGWELISVCSVYNEKLRWFWRREEE